MKRMKLLHFPVKGFGELSLIFSEAFNVVVVAIVLGIVSSCYQGWYRFRLSMLRYQKLSRYQVLSSQSLEVSVGQDLVVSRCQSAL
jgi:hypothetical protein